MAGSAGCGHITIATTILSSLCLPFSHLRLLSQSHPLRLSSFSSRFIVARFTHKRSPQERFVSLSPTESAVVLITIASSLSSSFSLSLIRTILTLSVPLSVRSWCARGSRDTPVRVRHRKLPSRRIVGLLQWPALLNVSLSSAFSLPMRRCARTIVSRRMGGSRQRDHRHRITLRRFHDEAKRGVSFCAIDHP